MNILFFGSDNYSAIALLELLNKNTNIGGIITGTTRATLPFPYQSVSEIAVLHNIPTVAVKNKRELLSHHETILSWETDVGFVASFGVIIPQEIFHLPQYGTLNLHPSLLPQYRGPCPMEQTILDGVETSGVTIMRIGSGVDTGAIVAQKQIPILATDTTFSLAERYYPEGVGMFLEIINKNPVGNFPEKPQDDAKATYTKKYETETAHIDWGKSVDEIDRLIRTFYPKPLAWTSVGELVRYVNPDKSIPKTWYMKRIQILSAMRMDDSIIPEMVVIEGKSPIAWDVFANGYVRSILR